MGRFGTLNSIDIAVGCVQAIAETDDVKTFRFVACSPVLFTYQPGQFVTLSVEINGKRVEPAYSIVPVAPAHQYQGASYIFDDWVKRDFCDRFLFKNIG